MRREPVPAGRMLPRVAAAGACVFALAACEPPPAADALVAPPLPSPFEVRATSFEDGAVAADEILVVELSDDIDVASVGPRSVHVGRGSSRRILRSHATAEGRFLRIELDAPRAPEAGSAIVLTLEGLPSPRALVARDGRPLASRTQIALRIGADSGDLEGPVLVETQPADGAAQVPPGNAVELRFSEPVAEESLREGDAVTLRIGGESVPVRVRSSLDRRRLLVRPAGASIPPDADVAVEVHRWLMDRAGNTLAEASPRTVRFRTRASSLLEIREDFVCDEMADRAVTAAGWGESDAPGLLVPRCGGACVIAPDTPAAADLGARESVRFQLLVHPEEGAGSLVSGLRLRFANAGSAAAGPLAGGVVEGGPFALGAAEPTFGGNRRFARLRQLATAESGGPWETDGRGGAVVDLPFATPLVLEEPGPVLFDVTLQLAEGARLGAEPDADRRALVDGGGRERLRPLVAPILSGGIPGARSHWYRADCAAPRWQRASVIVARADPFVRVVVEFQSAPDDGSGAADESSASAWTADLADVPAGRFVRFRVRFEGTASGSASPAVEAIVMPYIRRGREAR